MAHHPLTQFVESVGRLKRYYFRQEDLINLLRTGLYTDLTQEEIDSFEQYIRYLVLMVFLFLNKNLQKIIMENLI